MKTNAINKYIKMKYIKIKMKENLKLWRIKAKIQKYELKIYKSQILNNKQKKHI